MKAAVSWSGGKDSCAAYYQAMTQGIEVSHLLHFINGPARSHMSQGIDPRLIALQAEAIGLPIVQKTVQWETYEAGFREVLGQLRPIGVDCVIFGDIEEDRSNWSRKLCDQAGVEPILPLFEREPEQILKEFVHSGFEAIVSGVKGNLISKQWLGHRLDEEFISRLRQLGNVNLCGANGEYHTFVIDGPTFKKRIQIPERVKHYRDDCLWFLDISEYDLAPKM